MLYVHRLLTPLSPPHTLLDNTLLRYTHCVIPFRLFCFGGFQVFTPSVRRLVNLVHRILLFLSPPVGVCFVS